MKLKLRNFITIFVFLIIILAPHLHADPLQTIWYVAGAGALAKGNDENPGTNAYPLASVQRALSLIKAAYADEQFETAVIQIHGVVTNYGYDSQPYAMVTVHEAGVFPVIILRGTGQAVLNAGGRAGVLYLGSGNKVIIENLTLTGGKASNGAGVNVSRGELVLGIGAAISGNHADGSGGGVYLYGGNFTMANNALISGNISTASEYPDGGGGAYIARGTFTMKDESAIRSNRAVRGAGIYLRDNETKLLIEKGIIEDCESSFHGGGIYADSASFSIGGGATIQNNRAVNYGGGIYMIGNNVTLETGLVIRNNTALSGGGICINQSGNLVMKEGAVISANTADWGGGVAINGGGVATFTMTGGVIDNNIAKQSGGGIYTDDNAYINLSGNAVIRGNSATGVSYGGGIIINSSACIISENALITSNTAEFGGGIYICEEDSVVAMSGGLIEGNSARSFGGGVYVETSVFTITGSAAINSNNARFGGGVYTTKASYFTMYGNAIIRSNRAETGAGLYINVGVENGTPRKYIISGGSIDSNISADSGGGIAVIGCELAVEGGTVIADNSALNGAGIYLIYGSLSIGGNAVLRGNKAEGCGGAVQIVSDKCILRGNALISENTASNGSGLFLIDCVFLLEGGSITGNIASDCGAVYLEGSGEFSGGLISDNIAEYGGGVYIIDGTQVVMRGVTEIRGNTAAWGGGVFIEGEKNSFIVESGTISGNNASSRGGGVYSRYADSFVMKGGTIRNNSPNDI